ncbi:enoyl-CoA hydratase/isomerase family protein [Phaeovibrio sulfidiphilus]|uniref:Enoyl-CoA hydratase/isomerase family protein n=1 Tax=Phaeovibrio sulfidiphilus TaxID=1220600 RepID=A0A8J6YXI3_9PROT|nr:3-hydroxyacyl-CoA dehydrogenase/enoyl-CoA hydratase family protein [Phaeovibrio sulfidiphilus]MBE1237467.1 enoyl-CoA hydratase/isomerase family protein [Phaeovibrio sulfidiphilus]
MTDIKKAAVIGAGVMGAGIAAHMANAGIPVLLLDIVPENATDRSVIAREAIERLKKTRPAPLMSAAGARLMTPGNIEDDLNQLADCDWIVEAISEHPGRKQALYEKIEAVRRDGSIVSSNTSTIPLSVLTAGLGERFRRDFLITHFFNPPRYMRLLELVTGPDTNPAKVEVVRAFCDRFLGKGVVDCRDRPGFLANRLGAFWMQVAVVEALERGIDVETADAVLGRPFGVPKTAVFGLLDLVGLDLIPAVNASLAGALEPDDPFRAYARPIPLIETLIAQGFTGRKGRGGFYRLERDGATRTRLVLNLKTGDWEAERKPRPAVLKQAGKDLRVLLESPTPEGEYARAVMARTLAYAAHMVGDATDDPHAIDLAMTLGYGWKHGPFELLDRIGPSLVIGLLEQLGEAIPPFLKTLNGRTVYTVQDGRRQVLQGTGADVPVSRAAGVLRLSDIKLAGKPVFRGPGGSLWDLGDGVACFELTSKMGTFDAGVLKSLATSLERVGQSFGALVLYNDNERAFSAGANLGMALFAANMAAWPMIANLVEAGQKTFMAMRSAPFPVVGAPSGLALGGGCEILLHCDAVQAHAETYMGLVETGVGFVPAWGGCAEMLHRWQTAPGYPKGPMPAVARTFEILSMATVSESAQHAKELLYLRKTDGITMNRDRLLADAKARALSMIEGYEPTGPREYVLPGPAGRTALDLAVSAFLKQGRATPHDVVVAGALADVLTGGPEADPKTPLPESALLELEGEAFLRLARTPATLARVEHMLATGKPLRN